MSQFMQQFVVPQFIDVEDKILGPITIRQFLILLTAGLIIFLSFKFADFALFITTLAIIGGLALIFAFVKINGQQFHYFLLNVIQTLRRPSLRIWAKTYAKDELDYLRTLDAEIEMEEKQEKKPVKGKHIRDLSLVVNTGGYYRPEDFQAGEPPLRE